ncbi:phosphoglycolate phosphatase [Lachnospiraceae bacterium]|nr:phosphoglycolate phosphatase [Lachnospiraceae bacterium]
MYNHIFFDLDGTLTQSEFGIINSIIYALNKMGIEVDDPEYIKNFIGPPLTKAFKEFYNMNDQDADQATAYYREYYNAGELYNAPLYDGIEDTLKALKEKNKKLYVVTSKPTVFASRIVEHFDIMKYFEAVIGPEVSDKSYTKEEIVARAIEKTSGAPDECIMIGDRFYDIDGANANDIASIGVLYGYGERDELEKAGATYIADTPRDILDVITGTEENV